MDLIFRHLGIFTYHSGDQSNGTQRKKGSRRFGKAYAHIIGLELIGNKLGTLKCGVESDPRQVLKVGCESVTEYNVFRPSVTCSPAVDDDKHALDLIGNSM